MVKIAGYDMCIYKKKIIGNRAKTWFCAFLFIKRNSKTSRNNFRNDGLITYTLNFIDTSKRKTKMKHTI